MVEIKIVKTKKQQRDFVKFADLLYRDNEDYVPYCHKIEKNLFSHKKNPNLTSNEIVGFLAYQQGKIVGRILGINNRIEMSENQIIRFSHFDCINDSEVSYALLDAICDWAKTLKAKKIIGDIGFNDLAQCGVVSKVFFNSLATLQQKINFEYYVEHLKNFGFNSFKKFNEYILTLNQDIQIEKEQTTLNELMQSNDLKFVDGSVKFKLMMYGRKIFDLIYENSLSSHPTVIEEKVYEKYLKYLSNLYSSDDLILLINHNDDVVGCMLVTKNTSLALQTTRGSVLVSNRMYTVGGEFKNEFDISLYVLDKKYQNIASQIFTKKLAIVFKKHNYYAIHSNLWINNDVKKQMLESVFDMGLIRERSLFQMNLIKEHPSNLIVKRKHSDLIGRKSFGNFSKLS